MSVSGAVKPLAAMTVAVGGFVFMRDLFKSWKKDPSPTYLDWTMFKAPREIDAGALFKPLVMISCYYTQTHIVSTIGFVLYSDETTTLFWSFSDFLYTTDGDDKQLHKGKVQVTIKGLGPRYGYQFDGKVLFVDYQFDWAIIGVRNSKFCKNLNPATFSRSFPIDNPTFIDFVPGFKSFFVNDHTAKNQPLGCKHLLHVSQNCPGIVINAETEVVGIKQRCPGTKLSHVLPISLFLETLQERAQWFKKSDHVDVRFPQMVVLVFGAHYGMNLCQQPLLNQVFGYYRVLSFAMGSSFLHIELI